MKFSDGFWLNKPGYNVSYAAQEYEVTADDRSVTVFATAQWIRNRGMTLGGPCIEIRFTSTLENSIKVTLDHYKGVPEKEPSFELNEDRSFKPVINKLADGGYELISGKTRVVIGAEKGAWDIKYYYGDKLLTKQGWRTASYIEESAQRTENRMRAKLTEAFYADSETDDNAYMRDMFNIAVGENIYGFGEKFSTFVKNGQTVEVWNNDGGTCTEQSYKSIPFFVSSRGYGCLVNHPEKVMFEVASETVSKVAFAVQGQHLEYFVFGGDTIADVLRAYTDLTGKPGLPPAFSFGLWLTTSFTTDYDEKTVSSFIDEMERRDIPLEMFHFDSFWMKGYNWCDFTWDENMFDDPAGMLERLHKKHVGICVWINPYVSQRSSMFAEGFEHGYFIKKKDGSVFQTDMWQPGMAIVDFTNPAAREWYAGKLKALCKMGVDTFKTDFGERIPTDVVYYDGSDPYKMHNYYTYLYNRTVFDVLERHYGKGKACLFARSATVGGQKFPVHWGGDCFSNYESMWETIRGGLSLCMSGFGFFSHDISGFEATGTPDLYKRWSAFGLMSTHSRLHGNSSYRVPWNFDEESCDVVRHFTKLKGRLMPYLYANAVKTHTTGVPMMRAMVVDYTSDPAVQSLDRQYMLGDSLLVAPVFNEEGTVQFYLPGTGVWTDIQTGEELEGGKWYEKTYDYFGMPLYAKPGAMIACGDFRRNFTYDYAENTKITIYGLEDGQSSECEIFDAEANSVLRARAVRNGGTITVTAEGRTGSVTFASSQGLDIVRG